MTIGAATTGTRDALLRLTRCLRTVVPLPCLAAALAVVATFHIVQAQQLDMSHGGPISITAKDGIELRQEQRQVIARGDARAVRQNVTVVADRLTAFYRPKSGAPAQPAQSVVDATGHRRQRDLPGAG